MNFKKKILIENSIRYLLIFLVIALFWNRINFGLISISDSGNLEAIAVVMGIISLCALTGYFAFSYATVGKGNLHRFFGYLSASFLTIPLILTWVVLYFIASIWIPEMKFLWGIILGTLYLGTLIFDWLDLLRIGKDIAATSFFEKGNMSPKDEFSTMINLLKEGQRLEHSYIIIGKPVIDLGKEKNDSKIIFTGKWVINNPKKGQHATDKKIAETFERYAKKDRKIKHIINDLKKGQEQNIADSLIANLLELVIKKK